MADEYDSVKVISFDLFDTLILRPFVRPTDLFLLLGQLNDVPGFRNMRVNAEKEARRQYRREITLDEIYSFLPDGLQSMKDKECQMEIDLSFSNPFIKDLTDRICKDREIIIVTDMYLPRTVIESILSKNEVRYDRLYISSELGKTKHDGSLFDHILEDLNIKPDELLHVGDNRRADSQKPRSKGIRTHYVESPIRRYLREHGDERRFCKRNRSLTSSVIVFIDMMRTMDDDVWSDIGGRYGGPLTYSFIKHINDHHQNGSKILFTARDGYTLQKALEILDPDIQTEYVHAQRILSEMLGSDLNDIQVPPKLKDPVGHRRSVNLISKALRFYLDLTPQSESDIIKEYSKNKEKILDLQRIKFQSYSEHLKSICDSEGIEIVDCTTMKMTSQRFIQKALGRDVYAHYLVTLGEDSPELRYDTLCRWPYRAIGWVRVDIPEFLLCSPEMPVIGWDDGPVYDTGPEWERQRAISYQRISDSELEYVRKMTEFYHDHLPSMDYLIVNKWIMLCTAKGTRYRRFLKGIKWASSPDHSNWIPIVPWDGLLKSSTRLISEIIARINHK